MFRLKYFSIEDEGCPMKVGTDAVLLGAWAGTTDCSLILDIGTGCGIIALMLAQRSQAVVDAIEINEQCAAQASLNAAQSPWANRIQVLNRSWQDYVRETRERYDLIVTNPPYFRNSLKSGSVHRNMARHDTNLTYEEVIRGVNQLLQPQGRFCLILPVCQSMVFKELARSSGLFLLHSLLVRPQPSRPAHRILMEFGRSRTTLPKQDELSIREDEHNYSSAYKSLTADFYLDF